MQGDSVISHEGCRATQGIVHLRIHFSFPCTTVFCLEWATTRDVALRAQLICFVAGRLAVPLLPPAFWCVCINGELLYSRRDAAATSSYLCYAGRALWRGHSSCQQKRFLFLLFFSCRPRLCHWRRCSCSSVWLSYTSRVLPAHRRRLEVFFSTLPASKSYVSII